MADQMTQAFAFVVALNLMMFIIQIAIIEINPAASSLYNCEGSLYSSVQSGGCSSGSYTLNGTNPAADLASGESSVSPDTGNIFTDSFTALKSWFIQGTPLKYLVAITTAPFTLLNWLGLPSALVFALGGFWYLYTIFIVTAWLIGRNT